MKNYTEKEILDYLEAIALDLRDNWTAWGDVATWVRTRAIRKIRYAKRMIRSNLRIEYKNKFKELKR